MKDSSLMKIPFRWVVKHEERVIHMEKRRVEVYLTDEQFHFLQWLVKYDNEYDDVNFTIATEISACALCKIDELMDFYINDGLYESR